MDPAALTSHVWTLLHSPHSPLMYGPCWCVQWDTFEPSLVVVTFMACMALFWVMDVPLMRHTQRWRLNEDEEGMRRAWHWRNVAERLVGETILYIVPLALFDLAFPRRHLVRALLNSIMFCFSLNSFEVPDPSVLDLPDPSVLDPCNKRLLQLLQGSRFGNRHDDCSFSPFCPPQPEVAPSLSQLCLEVFLALFLYDLLFTLGHIACHRSDGLLIEGGFMAGSTDKQLETMPFFRRLLCPPPDLAACLFYLPREACIVTLLHPLRAPTGYPGSTSSHTRSTTAL